MNFALSMTLLVLAVAGFGLSLYLAAMSVRVRRGAVVWCVDTACPVVMRTQYAAVLRFPNAVLALPFYSGLAVFAALGMAGAATWLLPAVSVAAAMSVYLVYALLVKLRSPLLGHALNAAVAAIVILMWAIEVVRWLPVVAFPSLVILLRSWLAPWGFMWAMLAAIVASAKWLTWSDCSAATRRKLWLSLGYIVAWPGLDARRFLGETHVTVRAPGHVEWWQAIVKTLMGLGLMWGVVRLAPSQWPLLRGWVGMVGLAFVLHFGLFDVLALMWREGGVAAEHIFRFPIAARSVTEFWGRRWNLAFRDVAYDYMFTPALRWVRPPCASLLTFLASGLIHELVISLPVGAGFGGPTLYFLLQWLGVVVERSPLGRRLGLRRGWLGRVYACVVVLLPVGLLFHPAFVTGAFVPFLVAIGAW